MHHTTTAIQQPSATTVAESISIGNKSVLKTVINDTIIFFLNGNQHFGNFKP